MKHPHFPKNDLNNVYSGFVKEAFNYDEEFLEFCTEGYLILAAMHMMDIKALGEIPKQYPENSQERLDYMHKITTQIVDMIYISSQPIVENILNSEQSPTEDSYQFCVVKQKFQERTWYIVTIKTVHGVFGFIWIAWIWKKMIFLRESGTAVMSVDKKRHRKEIKDGRK